MASAADATFPSCEQCGEPMPSLARFPFCSLRCRNIASADHTPETLMKRFWAKVDKTAGLGPNGQCWHWTGRVDGRGYGEIKVAGRYKKAHRLALFGLENLSSPLFACHRCDNPLCVRRAHLYAGRPADNVHDLLSRGQFGPTIKPNSQRKLTIEQAREIRESTMSSYKLAAQFNVSRGVICSILRRRTYREKD